MFIQKQQVAIKHNGNFTVGILREDNRFYTLNDQGLININPGEFYRIMVRFNGTQEWKECYMYHVEVDGKDVIHGGFMVFRVPESDVQDIFEGPQHVEGRFKASNNESLLNGLDNGKVGTVKVTFYDTYKKEQEATRSVSKSVSRSIGTVLDSVVENKVAYYDYSDYGTDYNRSTVIEFKFNQNTERRL